MINGQRGLQMGGSTESWYNTNCQCWHSSLRALSFSLGSQLKRYFDLHEASLTVLYVLAGQKTPISSLLLQDTGTVECLVLLSSHLKWLSTPKPTKTNLLVSESWHLVNPFLNWTHMHLKNCISFYGINLLSHRKHDCIANKKTLLRMYTHTLAPWGKSSFKYLSNAIAFL